MSFSLKIFSETFLIIKRTERDIVINVYRSSYKVPVFLIRFLKNFELFGRILKNCPNIKIHENPSSGEPSCSMRTVREM